MWYNDIGSKTKPRPYNGPRGRLSLGLCRVRGKPRIARCGAFYIYKSEGDNVLYIHNDPFKTLFKAINNLYPDIKCRIQIDPAIKAPFRVFGKRLWGVCGYTFWPSDGSTTEIRVSAHIPYVRVVEITAHEVARVVAGPKAKHGYKWKEAFNAIHQEFMRLTEEE